MLATLVIFLREGVEASMIVAILLAYLNRIGRREHFRDVFIGVGAALILATAGGVAAYETIRSYDGSRVQTIFETVTYLIAATVLTYMTFWMRAHARSLSKELRARTAAALDGREFFGQRPGVRAHPEGHVGQHGRGDQVGDGLEDRLDARAVVAADRLVGGHSAGGGQDQGGAHPDEHVTEMLPPPNAVEVGEQDRDDHAGLNTLTQEDDERGEHARASVGALKIQLGLA